MNKKLKALKNFDDDREAFDEYNKSEEEGLRRCYHKNKDCDTKHRLHTYHNRGEKVISCYIHKPMGWKRK